MTSFDRVKINRKELADSIGDQKSGSILELNFLVCKDDIAYFQALGYGMWTNWDETLPFKGWGENRPGFQRTFIQC